MRARWVAAALVAAAAVLAGCGGGGLPRYGDLAELSAAAVARIQFDRTLATHEESMVTLGGQTVQRISADGMIVLGAGGPSSRSTFHGETRGQPSYDSELIVVPDAAYLLLPVNMRGAGPRYLRLDPNGTDPLNLGFAGQVRLTRLTGTRLYCLSTLGRTEIVRSEPGVRDGVPVMRYVLGVDLTQGSVDPSETEFYRRLGLDRIESVLELDAQDRHRRCTVDQALPGGAGRIVLDQAYRGHGDAVTIEAPPPADVTSTPPALPGTPG